MTTHEVAVRAQRAGPTMLRTLANQLAGLPMTMEKMNALTRLEEAAMWLEKCETSMMALD